jgi:CBS domain containing-hemolysin-like protein
LNKPLSKLLATFQKSNKHMAILIDEYGWVEWLITLEDVLEEIFWEIRDETDEETDDINKIWKDSFIVESHVGSEEILEEFNLDLKHIWLDEKEFGWETLSYLVTHKLERFPSNGEVILFDVIDEDEEDWNIKAKLSLKVLDIKDGKIGKVEIRKEINKEND